MNKQSTPAKELVKQANQIAESVYMMPAMSRKLIFFAMAKSAFQTDGFQTIETTEEELCQALGLTRGGTTYDVLRSITRTTKEQVFTIEDDGYNHVSWMAECQYVRTRGVFRFRLDPTLHQYTVAVKDHFQLVPLEAIGRLQGKYAIRIFELVMTQSGQEGKNGNAPGTWYYEETIDMIRHMFDIPQRRYKVMNDFRRRVIDQPIQEINEANIGIHIEPVYQRRRRRLYAVRFNVRRMAPSSPAIVSPVTESQVEDTALIAEFPDDYQRFLAEELGQPTLPFITPEMHERTAHIRAIAKLYELKKKAKR